MFPEVDDAAELGGGDGSAGEFNGGFDTGKGEALNAVTVEFEIAHFGAEKGALDGLCVVVFGKQLAVFSVVFLEEILVVPEGIVGVEGNGLDAAHGVARDCHKVT